MSGATLQRAVAAIQSGQLEDACRLLESVLRSDHHDGNAANLLALARRRQGQDAEAEALFRRAIAAIPEAAGFHNNLGNLLRSQGRNDEAQAAFRAALRNDPQLEEARLNLAELLWDLGQAEASMDFVQRGLQIHPQSPELLSLLGYLLARGGQFGAALPAHQRALANGSSLARVWCNYGDSLLQAADLEGAKAAFERCLALDPNHAKASAALLMVHQYLGGLSPVQLADLHMDWARRFAPASPARPWVGPPDPERRLRVGYLSPDFRDHSVAMFLEPVLEAHDRGQVELFGYASHWKQDEVTARLRRHCSAWRDVTALGAAEAAALVRQDRIDLLVELAGHSGGNRLDIVTLRPAPVQVLWLGYPGTSGVAAFQARITDAVVDPPAAPSYGVEQPVRLPGGFHCFRPHPAAPPVAPLPSARRGGFTFGSFNGLQKHTPAMLRLWAALLRRVPGSRLLIKAHGLEDPHIGGRFRALFEEEGVPASRLCLMGYQLDRAGHLALYGEVDLALDTFPYNGVTTTCEALWMGVPVVTLAGDRPASREAASLLHQAGLEAFISRTAQDYLTIAADWAQRLDDLGALRATLRSQLQASALMDGPGLAQALESAYRLLWRDWCARTTATAAGPSGR